MKAEQLERSAVYRLLARVLIAPVDHSLLSCLKPIEVELQNQTDPLAKAWQHLCVVSAIADPESLNDEFHHLFLGLGRGDLLPFRSYYETGFLMEKPLAELRADLHSLGYQRQSGNNEPEDHISAVCEVMALLITEQRDEQRYFYQQHINPWFEKFFKDLQAAASDSFYPAVACFAKEFLNNENTLLN